MTFKSVVEHHRAFALANPCEHAMQCADRRYMFWVMPAADVQCGVNLTVNVGEE